MLIFILAVVLINPFGQYAVNDDWDFYTHVRNFRQGDFIKNQLIDSSFILQGLTATAWSYVFGFNYNSLRALTILVTLGFIYGLVKISQELEVKKQYIVLGSFLIIFNPFILVSALSFMTEMYFLILVIWSLYFLTRYIKVKAKKDLVLSVLFASLSLLVRQIGFLLIPGVILCAVWSDLKNKKFIWSNYFYSLIIVLISSTVLFIWPQYSSGQPHVLGFLENALKSVSTLRNLPDQLLFSIPYIGFILFPLGIGIFIKLPYKYKAVVLFFTVFLFQIFYRADIFKFGNVFYPEGLMIKSNYFHHLTLFDNNIFKTFLNLVCLISFFSVSAGIFTSRKSIRTPFLRYFLIIFIFLLIPVLIYEGFYDRYLINGLVVLVITVLYWFSVAPNTEKLINLKMSYVLLSLYCLYGAFLVQDFVVTTKTEWKEAGKLQQARQLGNKLFLSGTYTRFNYVFSKINSITLNQPIPTGISYQCYVQKTVEPNQTNIFYQIINRVETSRTVNNFFKNPGIFEEKKLPGFRPPTKDQSKIVSKIQINVWSETLVGNKAYVVTYCQF